MTNNIGPNTSNAALSAVLMTIPASDDTLEGLTKLQIDAVSEAADRFLEMSYYDYEGDDICESE